MTISVGGDIPVKDFTTVMIYGAAKCGIGISIDDLSMPMLTDVIEYQMRLLKGDKTVAQGVPKRLSEIAQGGKI